jgi:hypothetical protein
MVATYCKKFRECKRAKKSKETKETHMNAITWQRYSRILLALAFVLAALVPVAQPQPVFAKGEIGYLWSLDFDFEKSFDGLLTINVGPWEDGELTGITESSTKTVSCTPMGAVTLDKGDAVFTGADYLKCSMDLATVVWNNHKLKVNPTDNYGSILMRARVYGAANTLAPIFIHPNAAYHLDFSQTFMVTPKELLSNGAGLSQANFAGVTINSWQTYTFLYRCISHGGPCDATLSTAGQTQVLPTAGVRTNFATGPTTFYIGYDGGSYFTGRISALRVDPGNSAH